MAEELIGQPLGSEAVQDEVIAADMADVESAARSWAEQVAEEIENPSTDGPSNFVRPLHNDVVALAEAGIQPEEIVAYGERGAEDVQTLSEYASTLEGRGKPQLIQEYVRLLPEVLLNDRKRRGTYDDSKDLHTTVAPRNVNQPIEYQEANRAYELSIQKRAMVLDRIKGSERVA